MNNAMRPRQDKEHTKDLTARFGRGCLPGKQQLHNRKFLRRQQAFAQVSA